MSAKSILLVEDSKPLREVMAERLKEAGFIILEASGGDEAFRLAQEHKPDMIITDIIMFPVDGLELAKRIRESGGWGGDVHIIALTNQNSSEEKTRIAPLHLSAYFVKTDTPLDDIVKNVKGIFNKTKK